MSTGAALFRQVCGLCGWLDGAHDETCYASPARVRRFDPPTSRDAAITVETTRLECIVLDAIHKLGGATIHEVAVHTGLAEVSVSPRFAPLREKGKIVDTGRRRENPSGRKGIVWSTP